MRWNFDNSQEWLDDMPPSRLSTEHAAESLEKALFETTRESWTVDLVPLGRPYGGGLFISPPPHRLEDGVISERDWSILESLFEAVPYSSSRWYVFPDEISFVFSAVGLDLTKTRDETS